MHFHFHELTSTNHCSLNGNTSLMNKQSNSCTTNTWTLQGLKVLLHFSLESKSIVFTATKRKRPQCGGPWRQSLTVGADGSTQMPKHVVSCQAAVIASLPNQTTMDLLEIVIVCYFSIRGSIPRRETSEAYFQYGLWVDCVSQ